MARQTAKNKPAPKPAPNENEEKYDRAFDEAMAEVNLFGALAGGKAHIKIHVPQGDMEYSLARIVSEVKKCDNWLPDAVYIGSGSMLPDKPPPAPKDDWDEDADQGTDYEDDYEDDTEENVNIIEPARIRNNTPYCKRHKRPLSQMKKHPWGYGCKIKDGRNNICTAQVWFNDRAQ